jgi:glutamate dehydrogenase
VQFGALSSARAQALVQGVRATLGDVRQIVADFQPLKAHMLACAEELQRTRGNLPPEEIAEGVAFLRWLINDRFTFLGARTYEYARGADGALTHTEPTNVPDSGLGVLRDPERFVLRRTAEPIFLTAQWRALLETPTPLVVAKSTLRSRVHRRIAADYVGVKRYAADGAVMGETRFIGLFTTEAFNDSTREIPLLRRKTQWVVENSGLRPGGHSEKSLKHTIETFPRDELWQVPADELLETTLDIVHLMDRPRPRVFIRRDPFNRFVSALVYVPRERYNSSLREAIGERLEAVFGGRVERFSPYFGEGALARVHMIITDIAPHLPPPNPAQLDAEIADLARTWEDGFEEALAEEPGLDDGRRMLIRERFEEAFLPAYRQHNDAREALVDARVILDAPEADLMCVRAFRRDEDPPEALRCKIYVRDDVLALSSTVPILENMGFFVDSEQHYELSLAAAGALPARSVHVHEIEMRAADRRALEIEPFVASFENAFTAIWSGQAENDGFNRIIVLTGVGWREAALLRALARFRQQSGLDPSQSVQEGALAAHPDIAGLILALFRVRFDPALPDDIAVRAEWSHQILERLTVALNGVASLDEDRALRRIAALVGAIVRTNYYQCDTDGRAKATFSFKIDSHALADLPAPRPYREIWVAGPGVEGVHLRFGPIARGGLRWSDRRDDFRTEVLDLVKAQQVKNAIIVPVGAKGGFFPKRLPPRGAPNYQEAGIAAYRAFLGGLLDITDNLDGETVVPPRDVVRWDEDDPYLVVAADKGTATFSDIANALARDYGFWLDDAFASGGSAGYDHKAMGITARGAWEAVKRHFREIGKNIQEEPFDVIGVGDMSGDVFGNGMLLSKQIRLIAAFDHRHIFIDPAPADLDASWVERKRLFDLPRSSWDDYDRALISEGGGVFARTLKSIPLTPQIAALTGIDASMAVTPAELIHAVLKAETELLWFGGIGAYVKAPTETHADVGDRANDGLRVNATEVRARVIGEGANLGVTQLGRIAFARKGGRINTDAVDNSAGVDTSDHEVNIKILLADAIRSGALARDQRDRLLVEMTDDVASLVLVDNYDQTLALTQAHANARADLDSHERMIERLEAAGKLSRAVEALPNAEEFRALRGADQGLTRPELAKLLAYAKIDLFDALTASPVIDDMAFEPLLVNYFPKALHGFSEQMKHHRLRRAIIATGLADDLVNMGGPTFVDRIREVMRADPVDVAAAFEAARRIFALTQMEARINALDSRAPAEAQTQLHLVMSHTLRSLIIYLLRNGRIETRGIEGAISAYAAPVSRQRALGWDALTEVERARAGQRRDAMIALGAPEDLAADVAFLAPHAAALDVADLAERRAIAVEPAAHLYRAVGAHFRLDALRAEAMALSLGAHWERLASRRTIESLFDNQRALADCAVQAIGDVSRCSDPAAARRAVAAWGQTLKPTIAPHRGALASLEADGAWTFAKIILAAAEIRAIAEMLGRA